MSIEIEKRGVPRKLLKVYGSLRAKIYQKFVNPSLKLFWFASRV